MGGRDHRVAVQLLQEDFLLLQAFEQGLEFAAGQQPPRRRRVRRAGFLQPGDEGRQLQLGQHALYVELRGALLRLVFGALRPQNTSMFTRISSTVIHGGLRQVGRLSSGMA